ncbi:hypothetical protein DN748_04270 [Sinomicrobium soli]|nr:hypothetical protein DN748_04270 [Sinomicrobium sp. N-1-3-6]
MNNSYCFRKRRGYTGFSPRLVPGDRSRKTEQACFTVSNPGTGTVHVTADSVRKPKNFKKDKP